MLKYDVANERRMFKMKVQTIAQEYLDVGPSVKKIAK